jgi:hypothetical protein
MEYRYSNSFGNSNIHKHFFNKQKYFGLLEIVFGFLNLEDQLRLITLSKRVLSIVIKSEKIEVI